jgi:hypothetical protein
MLRRLHARSSAPLLVDSPVPPRSADVVAPFDEIRLTYNTHNRHVFDVAAARDGYVVLGLPWLAGFEGRVDGRRVPLVKANALYPAVFVPPGRHVVEFRFVSRPFLVGLGLAVLAAIGWVAWWTRVRRGRRFVLALAIVLGAALAWKTQRALFDGPSFGKAFRWQAAPESPGAAP